LAKLDHVVIAAAVRQVAAKRYLVHFGKKKKKIYLPKRLVARKGFNPSTLATIHTIKQK